MIAAFEPIGLHELVDAAALTTRVDRKYPLDRRAAAAVLRDLHPATRVLEVDGARAMAYESVYFDTPDLLSYRMAAHGRRRRFKLRTRSYLDSEVSYLEVKTKGSRSATVKERIEYGLEDRDILTPDGREYAEAALDGIVEHPEELELEPTLITRYERTTLYLPGSGSRATIDTRLSFEGDRTLHTPDLVVIETKSAGAACELDRLLWAHGHRPASLSKFGTGLAALRPELPSTKWARVLRHHFTKAA